MKCGHHHEVYESCGVLTTISNTPRLSLYSAHEIFRDRAAELVGNLRRRSKTLTSRRQRFLPARHVEGAILMLSNYLPVLIFVVIAIAIATIAISLVFPRTTSPDSEKSSAYECGFESFEDSRMKFDVRYYLVAILFIIFDLEIAFLFPWAVVLDKIGLFGFVAMAVFLGILVIGFIYEWEKEPWNGNRRHS